MKKSTSQPNPIRQGAEKPAKLPLSSVGTAQSASLQKPPKPEKSHQKPTKKPFKKLNKSPQNAYQKVTQKPPKRPNKHPTNKSANKANKKPKSEPKSPQTNRPKLLTSCQQATK
jgi:hypothetical protein